jgi:hypothetical protein
MTSLQFDSSNTFTVSYEIITGNNTIEGTFDLSANKEMHSLMVTDVSGSGDISYNISPGDISGIFSIATIGSNLLSGNPLLPTADTTYTLTFTTESTTTLEYTLTGRQVDDYGITGYVATADGTWTATNTDIIIESITTVGRMSSMSTNADGTRMVIVYNTGSNYKVYDLINNTWTQSATFAKASTRTLTNVAMSGNGKIFYAHELYQGFVGYEETSPGTWTRFWDLFSNLYNHNWPTGGSYAFGATGRTTDNWFNNTFAPTFNVNYDGKKISAINHYQDNIGGFSNNNSGGTIIFEYNGSNKFSAIGGIISAPGSFFWGDGGSFIVDDDTLVILIASNADHIAVSQYDGSNWNYRLTIDVTDIKGMDIDISGYYIAMTCTVSSTRVGRVFQRQNTDASAWLQYGSDIALTSPQTGNNTNGVSIATGGQTLAIEGVIYKYNSFTCAWETANTTFSSGTQITYNKLSSDGSRLFTANAAATYGDYDAPQEPIYSVISFDSNNNITIENALPFGDTDEVTFILATGYDMMGLTLTDFSGSTISSVNYTVQNTTRNTSYNGSFSLSDVGTNVFLPGFASGTYNVTFDLSGTEGIITYKLTGTQTDGDYDSRTLPNSINGLIGHYVADKNFTINGWRDMNGNNEVTIGGVLELITKENYIHGGDGIPIFPYLKGTTNSSITWPKNFNIGTNNDYTLIHVTRYDPNALNRKRIIDRSGHESNWLEGHWGGYAGVSHKQGWLGGYVHGPTNKTSHSFNNSDVWVFGISRPGKYTSSYYPFNVDSNQDSFLNNNGWAELAGGSAPKGDYELTINNATGEKSDFNVAEIIAYNTTLTDEQVEQMKTYLMDKYKNLYYDAYSNNNITFDGNNQISIENALPFGDTDVVTFTLATGYEMTGLTLTDFSGSTTSSVNYTLHNTTTDASYNGSFSSTDAGNNVFSPFDAGTYKITFDLSGSEGITYKLTGTQVADYTGLTQNERPVVQLWNGSELADFSNPTNSKNGLVKTVDMTTTYSSWAGSATIYIKKLYNQMHNDNTEHVSHVVASGNTVTRFAIDPDDNEAYWWNPSSGGTFQTGLMTGTYTLDSPTSTHMDNVTMVSHLKQVNNSGGNRALSVGTNNAVGGSPSIHKNGEMSGPNTDIDPSPNAWAMDTYHRWIFTYTDTNPSDSVNGDHGKLWVDGTGSENTEMGNSAFGLYTNPDKIIFFRYPDGGSESTWGYFKEFMLFNSNVGDSVASAYNTHTTADESKSWIDTHNVASNCIAAYGTRLLVNSEGFTEYTPISFDASNNLTIENSLPEGDTDSVSFRVVTNMSKLTLDEFTGSSTTSVNYIAHNTTTNNSYNGNFSLSDKGNDIYSSPGLTNFSSGRYNIIFDLSGSEAITYKLSGTQETFDPSNILTISNEIDNSESHTLTFALIDHRQMLSLIVTDVSGSGDVSYNISPGDISGIFSRTSVNTATIGSNLLSGNELTPSYDTSYTLTLSTDSTTTIGYSLRGSNKAYKIRLNLSQNDNYRIDFLYPNSGKDAMPMFIKQNDTNTAPTLINKAYHQELQHNIKDVESFNAVLEKGFDNAIAQTRSSGGYCMKPKTNYSLPNIYFYRLEDNYDGTISALFNAIPVTTSMKEDLYPEYDITLTDGIVQSYGNNITLKFQSSYTHYTPVPPVQNLPVLLNYSSNQEDIQFSYNSSTAAVSSNVISNQFPANQLSDYYRFDNSNNIYIHGSVIQSQTEYVTFDLDTQYEMEYLTIADYSGSSGSSAIEYVLSSDNLSTDVFGSFNADDKDTTLFTFGFRTGTYTLSLNLSGTESVSYMLTGTRIEDYNDTHFTFDSSNNFRMENILLPNDIDSVYFYVAKGMSLRNIKVDTLVETVEADISYSIINRTTNNEIQSGTFDSSGTYLLQYPLRGDVSYNFIIELSNNQPDNNVQYTIIGTQEPVVQSVLDTNTNIYTTGDTVIAKHNGCIVSIDLSDNYEINSIDVSSLTPSTDVSYTIQINDTTSLESSFDASGVNLLQDYALSASGYTTQHLLYMYTTSENDVSFELTIKRINDYSDSSANPTEIPVDTGTDEYRIENVVRADNDDFVRIDISDGYILPNLIVTSFEGTGSVSYSIKNITSNDAVLVNDGSFNKTTITDASFNLIDAILMENTSYLLEMGTGDDLSSSTITVVGTRKPIIEPIIETNSLTSLDISNTFSEHDGDVIQFTIPYGKEVSKIDISVNDCSLNYTITDNSNIDISGVIDSATSGLNLLKYTILTPSISRYTLTLLPKSDDIQYHINGDLFRHFGITNTDRNVEFKDNKMIINSVILPNETDTIYFNVSDIRRLPSLNVTHFDNMNTGSKLHYTITHDTMEPINGDIDSSNINLLFNDLNSGSYTLDLSYVNGSTDEGSIPDERIYYTIEGITQSPDYTEYTNTFDGSGYNLVLQTVSNENIHIFTGELSKNNPNGIHIVQGKVGVGKRPETHDFEVSGNVFATGNITVDKSIYAYSDRRLKTNVTPIDYPLDKLKNMRGVQYDRIDRPEYTNQIGVIAQEMEQVLPEVVNDEQTNHLEYKSVCYSTINSVLIESIKALEEMIQHQLVRYPQIQTNLMQKLSITENELNSLTNVRFSSSLPSISTDNTKLELVPESTTQDVKQNTPPRISTSTIHDEMYQRDLFLMDPSSRSRGKLPVRYTFWKNY